MLGVRTQTLPFVQRIADTILAAYTIMEVPVDVSQARKELAEKRKHAYKVREEAASKIQRWYRSNSINTVHCGKVSTDVPDGNLSGFSSEEGSDCSSKFTKDGSDPSLGGESQAAQDVRMKSSALNQASIRTDNSVNDEFVRNELAVALALMNQKPFSSLTRGQQDRVSQLRAEVAPSVHRECTKLLPDSNDVVAEGTLESLHKNGRLREPKLLISKSKVVQNEEQASVNGKNGRHSVAEGCELEPQAAQAGSLFREQVRADEHVQIVPLKDTKPTDQQTGTLVSKHDEHAVVNQQAAKTQRSLLQQPTKKFSKHKGSLRAKRYRTEQHVMHLEQQASLIERKSPEVTKQLMKPINKIQHSRIPVLSKRHPPLLVPHVKLKVTTDRDVDKEPGNDQSDHAEEQPVESEHQASQSTSQHTHTVWDKPSTPEGCVPPVENHRGEEDHIEDQVIEDGIDVQECRLSDDEASRRAHALISFAQELMKDHVIAGKPAEAYMGPDHQASRATLLQEKHTNSSGRVQLSPILPFLKLKQEKRRKNTAKQKHSRKLDWTDTPGPQMVDTAVQTDSEDSSQGSTPLPLVADGWEHWRARSRGQAGLFPKPTGDQMQYLLMHTQRYKHKKKPIRSLMTPTLKPTQKKLTGGGYLSRYLHTDDHGHFKTKSAPGGYSSHCPVPSSLPSLSPPWHDRRNTLLPLSLEESSPLRRSNLEPVQVKGSSQLAHTQGRTNMY